ncbi:homocysteine S-methyltransferase [Larsenimonas rhizosphaerae]|uniref:homocysteine S-methyltransferase n=1 Tax=Larsenimonas rhizosphaerae TaxID=2944682 RepID=UPI002033D93D|nr:homocysteine S-methyltransferase [Larsenimonas rhizosphaerae]MCM2131352.1 homocysteine S-methyltransferase [Larsenimonas rhizosphaerae]
MPTNPIHALLETVPFAVVDGALATELERHGCDLNDSLWSARVLAEQPELITRVHRDYFEAGADITITASYQATFEGFMARGMSEAQAGALIARSVSLACEARDAFWADYAGPTRPRPLVAASVGPYGAYLADGSEYRGGYAIDEEALMAFHRPRIKALVEAGADLLACETLPSLVEAKALVRVLAEFPEAQAWVTFSARDGHHISEGTPIAECATWLDQQPQVVAMGVNCTALEHIESLLTDLRAHTCTPLLVYPNSGEVYDPITKTWRAAEAGECGHHESAFTTLVPLWRQAGASLIGGCCRTGPDDVRAIAALRDASTA